MVYLVALLCNISNVFDYCDVDSTKMSNAEVSLDLSVLNTRSRITPQKSQLLVILSMCDFQRKLLQEMGSRIKYQ